MIIQIVELCLLLLLVDHLIILLTLRGSTGTGSQQITKEVSRKNGRNILCYIPHPTTSGQYICLVCLTVFNQFKVYTIKRHFESKHKKLMGLEPDGAASKYARLLSAYNKEHEALSRPVTIAFRQCPAHWSRNSWTFWFSFWTIISLATSRISHCFLCKQMWCF